MKKEENSWNEFLRGLGLPEEDLDRYREQLIEMLCDCEDEEEISDKIDQFVWRVRDSKK